MTTGGLPMHTYYEKSTLNIVNAHILISTVNTTANYLTVVHFTASRLIALQKAQMAFQFHKTQATNTSALSSPFQCKQQIQSAWLSSPFHKTQAELLFYEMEREERLPAVCVLWNGEESRCEIDRRVAQRLARQ